MSGIFYENDGTVSSDVPQGEFYDDSSARATAADITSSIPLSGDANTLPVVSDTPQIAFQQGINRVQDLLGAVGSAVRAFGTTTGAVGANTTRAGQTSGAQPSSKIGTWIQNSSGTDKLIAVAAVAAIYAAVK